MRTGPRRDNAGYTVIELLLVMIVFGVLLTITYLRVAPALERGRVRGAAGILASDLQYAQVLAARYRAPMVISINVSQRSYQIADRSGVNVYRTRNFGSGSEYALDELSAKPATLEVFPNAIVAQNAMYMLGLNGYRRRVTFSQAGQIRVTTFP